LAGDGRTKEAIREALKATIDSSPFDRSKIAEEITRLTGESVSEHAINMWLAESKTERRFPLEFIAALVQATGNPSVIKASLRGTDFIVITKEEYKLLELGRIVAEETSRRKRKKVVMEELGL